MGNERDCQALLSLLTASKLPTPEDWTAPMRQAATGMIWKDFLSKLAGPLEEASPIENLRVDLTQAIAPEAPGDTAARLLRATQAARPKFDPVDVLLICPLTKELNPSLVAFGDDPFKDEDENVEGHKLFFTNISRQGRKSVSVAISVITKPRNAPAGIITYKLLTVFRRRPELVLLTGIGGGVRSEVTLGDVVISSKVIDVAGGRKETLRDAPRDDEFPVERQLACQLSYLPPRLQAHDEWSKWMRGASELISSAGNFLLPDAGGVASAEFRVEDGIIVAGEKLIRDGSLPRHLEERDQRIRSCDMEGSGFAQAAEESDVQWAIFRGISDYGDPDKSNEWQALAAYAAASAARRFLETEFRFKSEMAAVAF